MHSKRLTISNLWSIPKKGNKFIVVAKNKNILGIPILVAMRDILKHVQTRKELKKILLEKKVEVNGVPIKDDRYSLLLFDTIGLPSLKKYYKISLSNSGKISFEETDEKKAGVKLVKIVNKKIIPGNIIQLGMNDGRNILSKEKIKVGDSILLNLKDKKIEKHIPFKEKVDVLIIKGKYLGNKGKIEKINDSDVTVLLETGKVNLNKGALMVLN